MTTTVFDHLGNKFTNIKQMCNHYGITIQQYYNRKSRNWPLEKILTTPISSRPIIPASDHLGNKFPSIKKLCEHYGISQASYTLRIKRGMTKKDALTTPVKNPQSEYTKNNTYVRDHLNNKFSTMKEMCDCYGITTKQYKERTSYGWPIEKILTTPIKTADINRTDHLGNKFATKKEMCKHYGISESTFSDRQKKGMSLEEILTTPRKFDNISDRTDHLGNIYSSKRTMCEHYNIDMKLYDARLRRGVSKQDALTNNKYYNIRMYTDHFGNTGTLSDICRIHNVSEQQIASRLALGWSLYDALTRPAHWRANVFDHNGIAYPSNQALAKTYGLTTSVVAFRLKQNWSLRSALLIPMHFSIKPDVTLFDNYRIIKKIDSIYYECNINGNHIIKTKLQIYDDFAERINTERNV